MVSVSDWVGDTELVVDMERVPVPVCERVTLIVLVVLRD